MKLFKESNEIGEREKFHMIGKRKLLENIFIFIVQIAGIFLNVRSFPPQNIIDGFRFGYNLIFVNDSEKLHFL